MTDERDTTGLLAETFRAEWPRLVATAMRLTGDLQAAEDVASDVLLSALHRWPLAGIPDNPAAWLMTACRNRALNTLRDAGRARQRLLAAAPALCAGTGGDDDPAIADDRLRLVFICCHPVLARDAQVALTLRMLGGLSTVEIARAWHVPPATIGQRITRAKRTLADRRVPFAEPAGAELADRLPAVLDVVYLIFNEGYLSTGGTQLTRAPLATEAHRLARLLTDLLPDQPEVWALRALIALHSSRDTTRLDPEGNLLTLEHQDRNRWDHTLIAEGLDALATAEKATAATGPLTLQARIAAAHATAATFEDTDWTGILNCYDQLYAQTPIPVVALHRAVAVAMATSPQQALPLLDTLVGDPALARTHRVWAIRADLHRRTGNHQHAIADYDHALALVDNDAEHHYLTRMRQQIANQETHRRQATKRPSPA